MQEADQAAIDAVGEGAGDDYLLKPEEHGAALPPNAAPLNRVLVRPDIAEIIARYVEADAEALRRQSLYRRYGALAIYALATPAVLGALLVLKDLAPGLGEQTSGALRQVVLSLQFLAIALSLVCGFYLSNARPFDRWMRARGEAEQARQDLFEEVIAAEEAAGENETRYEPLALEYFRRYQLGVQRAYYRVRSEEAWARTRKMRGAQWLTMALLLVSGLPLAAALYTTLFGGVSPFEGAGETTLIALGALGGGVASTLSALSLLHLDRRNASKYAIASKNLEYFAGDPLKAARRGAAEGDRRALYAFVQQVHDVISSEHREWVEIWRHRRRLNEMILKLPEPDGS